MASRLEGTVRSKVSEFAAVRLDLRSLQDWLAPIIWEIEGKRDPGARELVYTIELAIAEYSAGHLLECDFRAQLESLVVFGPDSRETAACNQWLSIGSQPSPVDDSLSAMVFGSSSRN